MSLLGLQQRSVEIGQIRYGYSTRNDRGKKVPHSTDKWIFTTPDAAAAAKVAELYGGAVEPWPEKTGVWQVRSEVTELTVTVPQTDQVISQFWEMWQGGNALRRCDGLVERLSGNPCMCPPDMDARKRLSKQMPPAACGPKSRLSVVLSHVPGLGTWKLASAGWEVAKEIGGTADFMQSIRDGSSAGAGMVLLTATLRIVNRGSGVKTHRAAVLTLDDSLHALVSGEAARRSLVEQLPPPPNRLALTAGAPAAAGAAAPSAAAAPDLPGPAEGTGPGGEDLPPEEVAHRIALAAAGAETAAQVAVQAQRAAAAGVSDEYVTAGETVGPLVDFLKERWKQLNAAEQAASAAGGAS